MKHAIDRLAAVSREFGPGRAKEKLLLLEEIAALERHAARRIVLLHETLCFMRAYPDSERVLRAVGSLASGLRRTVEEYTDGDTEHPAFMNTGLPASSNAYGYSYAVLRRLVELFPGCVELDWAEIHEIPPIVDAINLTVLPGESRGLEDEFLELRDWLQECATKRQQTTLEVVLDLFARSDLSARQQMHVFETCNLPVVFRLSESGSGRCEIVRAVERVFFQSRPMSTDRFPLKPRIVRPLGRHRHLDTREGRGILDLALAALSGRNLEIHPLIYGDAADVTLVDGERGMQLVLAGMVAEFRQVLESDFFFLVLKNGVPMAYGPASVFLGCCEMGINLFPEFRGGEIRNVYALLMRALHHLADVRYFFLTSYGMGEGNPEALKTGAFWFYRKLGFRAADPDIEALAREEEKIMRRRPRYRCSMSTLRELSYTDAYFDLSGGECVPVNFEKLGQAVSQRIRDEFGGRRARAEREDTRRVVRLVGIEDFNTWTRSEARALRRAAPILAQIRGLSRWPAEEVRALAGAFRARGGGREVDYIRELAGAPRLPAALHAIASP